MNETNGMQEAKTIDFLMNVSLFDELRTNELRTLARYMNLLRWTKMKCSSGKEIKETACVLS